MSDPEIVAADIGATDKAATVDAKMEEKSPEAMFKLAEVLRKGDKDTPKDISRAVELYQSALERGYMAASGPLLEILKATPAASPEDTAAAMEMMGVDDEEMDESAKMVEKAGALEKSDPKQAVEIYNNAINEFDDPDAMNSLAIFLEAGAEDQVPADPKRAAELYNQAAEHENYEAMFNLAVLLVKGANGVPKDPKRAVKLYETVITEEMDADAMKNLAILLMNGAEGVPVDKERAEKLLEDARSMENAPMEDDEADEVMNTTEADDEKTEQGETKNDEPNTE